MTLAVTASERARSPWSDRAALLRRLYRTMAIVRRLDLDAVALQRQGILPGYAPVRGQEAAQVGSAAALDPSRDVVVDGAARHAVGWALAAKLDRTGGAAIASFGGDTGSHGDIHDAMNTAVASRLPVVFFCARGSVADPVAGRRMPRVRVDGNDVLAVYDAMSDALERARRGDGPTIIETMPFRPAVHPASESSYPVLDGEGFWPERDPLAHAEQQLRQTGTVDDDFFAEVADAAGALADRVRDDLAALGGRPVTEVLHLVFSVSPVGPRRPWLSPAED